MTRNKQFTFDRDTVAPNIKTPIVFKKGERLTIGEVLDKLNELNDENTELNSENTNLIINNKELKYTNIELAKKNEQLKQQIKDLRINVLVILVLLKNVLKRW